MSSTDLAARVIEITGSTRQVALNLLAVCANDVQEAVTLFFTNEQTNQIDVQSDAVNTYQRENDVRAPIAPIREQMIGQGDDNFRYTSETTGAKGRLLPRIKVCPLRDFAREGSIMEESLTCSDSTTLTLIPTNDRPTSSSKPFRCDEMPNRDFRTSFFMNTSMGRLGLGDLFRPPIDLAVGGTFQYARTKATNMKRFLLVNLQSDNFKSQVLNRDVWSQVKVRNLIQTNFLLWQVSCDTSEGERFATFYHCNQTPFICIIDPRTGELLWKNELANKTNFLETLQVFLSEHVLEEFFRSQLTEPYSSSSMQSCNENILTKTMLLSNHRKRRQSNAIELTEEEQILLAVRNSLLENESDNNISKKSSKKIDFNDNSFQNFLCNKAYNDKKIEPGLYTAYLGLLTDEITTLRIRLVNARLDESFVVKWPADTSLRALQLYILERFPILNKKFKLISPFPRKIFYLDEECLIQTLKGLNLHPSSTLHVYFDE